MQNKMDFTLSAYKQLISTLQSQCYFCQTLEEYIQNPKDKVVILRHDVDRLPGNSLKTALLENELGIRATYFFRTIPQTFKPEIIKEIAEMGHEIGYHYENLSAVSKNDLQITQINADLIGHRHTRTYPSTIFRTYGVGTDIYPADRGREKTEFRGQKSVKE